MTGDLSDQDLRQADSGQLPAAATAHAEQQPRDGSSFDPLRDADDLEERVANDQFWQSKLEWPVRDQLGRDMPGVLIWSGCGRSGRPFERHVIEGTRRNVQRARHMGSAASIGKTAPRSRIGRSDGS